VFYCNELAYTLKTWSIAVEEENSSLSLILNMKHIVCIPRFSSLSGQVMLISHEIKAAIKIDTGTMLSDSRPQAKIILAMEEYIIM